MDNARKSQTSGDSRIFVFKDNVLERIGVEIYRKRTATCGELRKEQIGTKVTLTGWIDKRRDLGGLIFIDLRDRYGKTQIVFSPERSSEAYDLAKTLRSEFVLSVTGTVKVRPEGTINKDMPTGEIEVDIDELIIVNTS